MRHLIFILTRKKKQFLLQMINVQHFCVPRNQMPLSQGQNTSFSRKRMSPGGWGAGESHNSYCFSPGNLFFFAFMVILSLLQLQILVLLVSLAKSAWNQKWYVANLCNNSLSSPCASPPQRLIILNYLDGFTLTESGAIIKPCAQNC